MNKLELFFYNLVKNNPRLKRRIRDVYQRICDLVPVKRTESAYPIEVRQNFFFGFHDKCPFSADNRMLLSHHLTLPLRMPEPNDTVEIGYFSGPNYRDFRKVASTRAWNWQQGSMLQWVGASSNIVFNDYDGKGHVARIVNKKGELLLTLPLPVAAISPDGTKGLSHSFARLHSRSLLPRRGYGYANGIDPEQKNLVPSKHGLHLIDIASGQTNLIFTVAAMAKIQPEPSMTKAFHYFSHCQFSPSGERFVFFHRWVQNDNRQWTRMISCDLKGNNIFIFPTSGMVSHVAWRDNENILAYAQTKKYGDRYYLFRDGSSDFSIIGEDSFNSDGHPSFSKDRRWIITDSYPDRFRIRYLILYDTKNKKRYNLAKLYSPRKYVKSKGLIRCDLHPRWNRDGTMVCFDSAHTGTRTLCTITLGNLDGPEEPLSI